MEEQQLPYNPNPTSSPSVAGPAIKMALMIAGMLIVFTLVLYLMNQATNKWLGWINYILILSGLVLATNNFRDEEMGGFITFGKAFYFGFMISLFTSLIFGMYFYIHLKFIAHDILGQMLQMAEEAMAKQQLPEEAMQQAINIDKKYVFIPGAMAVFTFIGTLLLSTLLSLLSAGIARRNPPPTFPPAV